MLTTRTLFSNREFSIFSVRADPDLHENAPVEVSETTATNLRLLIGFYSFIAWRANFGFLKDCVHRQRIEQVPVIDFHSEPGYQIVTEELWHVSSGIMAFKTKPTVL